MRRPSFGLFVLIVALPAAAAAQPGAAPGAPDPGAGADDGYCDHVQGVAAAESATLLAPDVFGSFGYVDQAAIVTAPDSTSNDLRLTLGISYDASKVYQGVLTRSRAKADCRRHQALARVQGATTHQALEAKAAVLDGALAEAARILAEADDDLASRRATAQDVTATRLRVDQLRAMAAETRRALASLPPPPPGSLTGALAAYQGADAEVESIQARLRRARAFDLGVRFGYDKFLDGDDESPYFALVAFRVNLGVVLQGSGNARAAAGRRRMAQGAAGELDATMTRMREILSIQQEREAQTAIIVADLDKQLDALRGVGGESGRRLRNTVWFEWVKAKAEHAYLASHVASLRQVLDEEAAP